MSIEKIFRALNEYVKLKRTHDSGDKYSFPLLQAKHEVENALIELIDSRIKAYMGRERRRSQATANSQTMPSVTGEMQKSEVVMMDALNSAPTPPTNPHHWLLDDPLGWIESYSNWYYGKRNASMNKGE